MLKQLVCSRGNNLMIDMKTHSKGHIPGSVRQAFIQYEQVLSQSPPNLQIARMDSTTDQVIPCIVSWSTTIDGINIVKPEVIGMEMLKSIRIFFAPGRYQWFRILAKTHNIMHF